MRWFALVLLSLATTAAADDAALVARSLRTLSERAPVWDRRIARRTLAFLGDVALPAVEEGLRTGDRRLRRDLVAAVGDMDSPSADAVLVSATRDESWGVREQAIRALGTRGRGAAAPVVLAGLRDPVWRVRTAAVVALRRLAQTAPVADGDALRAAIASRLLDRDREVRRAAAWAVFRLEHEPSLLAAFAVLWSGPRHERPRVIQELPRTDRPSILAILERIMADPHEDLAFAAAERYAAIRGLEVLEKAGMRVRLRNALLRSTGKASLVMRRLRADALPFLVECLEKRSPDSRISRTGPTDKPRARHILDLMASLGTTDAIPVFKTIIEETDDDFLLRHAIDVGRLAFPKELEAAFETRYRDETSVVYSIQRPLLISLARSNPELAAPLLAEAAASRTMDLHMAVLSAVESVGDRCDRPNLLRAVLRTARNHRMLPRALRLAAQVLGEEADPLILARLGDDDLRIRAAAVTALTTRKSASTAEALRALFVASAPNVDEDPETPDDDPTTLRRKETLRKAILLSLPLIAPEPDFEFLAGALAATEALVRSRAAEALGKHAGSGAAALLIAALDHETDETVRPELVKALVACPGEAAAARLDLILREGDRQDRLQALRSLATADRPVPDAVREGLTSESWDSNLREKAAAALVERGTEEDLDRLVTLLAQGAPPDLENVVLQALGDRKAAAQAPGLVALLPGEPLVEIDPGRRDFVLSLIECLGRIGNPVAFAPLEAMLGRARLREDEDLAAVDDFRLQALGLCAQALAKVDPRAASAHLLDIILDPATARFHWERGVTWTNRRHRLNRSFRDVCYGLQRVPDTELAPLVGEALAAHRRSGRLLELGPGYMAAVADKLASPVRKRPRKATAARVRNAILGLPPRVTRHAFDAARSLATRHVFLGSPAEIVATAERAHFLMTLDPGLEKSAELRRRETDLLRALALAGKGAAAGEAGDPAERQRLFLEAAAIDTGNTDIAYYLAWGGLYRGLALEHVKTWTRRATALSASGDSQRWTILDLEGIVLRRAGELDRAEVFLERADRASRQAKSGMAAYHRAVVLCELGRPERARAVLLQALSKDDTWWSHARRERSFAPLREDDGIEQLIAEAAETFD